MRLRKPCEHGAYDMHDWVIDGFGHTRVCPGGEFLADDAGANQIGVWPRCSKCDVACVLRRMLNLTEGRWVWMWQRDCKHRTAELVIGTEESGI